MLVQESEVGRLGHSSELSAQQLRIVSWNINRGLCLSAVIEFLSFVKADVVLLQEVDKNARRTGGLDIPRELSLRLGLNYVFALEFEELSQRFNGSPALHGQTTLSRWPISQARVLTFQNQSKFWRPRWWIPQFASTQRRLGGRIALISTITVGSREVVTYNVHLESRNGDDLRDRQLREVLEDASQQSMANPVIIGGDFNFDLRDTERLTQVEDAAFWIAGTAEVPTKIVSLGESRAIDFILTSKELEVAASNVHRSVHASDHYPVSASLRLRRPDLK